MRTVLRLTPWLVLAGVGAVLSGLWGFLAVAILYVLVYVVLRPRVPVVATPERPATREEEERRNEALAASVFDKAGKARAASQAAKPKGR